jgi:hypothetical protein
MVHKFILAGLMLAIVTPFASAEERSRNISSLNELAAPELSQAVQNAGRNNVPYLPTDISSESKAERIRFGTSLPVYSNSFPPMIAQVRTQNWDQ